MKRILKPVVLAVALLGLFATFNVANAQSASVSCVGSPPANPYVNLSWPSYSVPVPPARYDLFLLPRQPSSLLQSGGSTSYTHTSPVYGTSPGYQVEVTDQVLTVVDAFQIYSPTATCNATISVVETPVTGGTWTINPESKTGSSNTMRPSSSGSAYTLSVNSVPTNYVLQSVTNSQNSSATLTLFPAAGETYTITYAPVPPPQPPPPTTPTATPGACDSGTITITWGTSAGATSYTLMDGGSTIYTGVGTSYTHNVAASSVHTYTLYASNANGNSASTGTTPSSTTAPAACGGGSAPTVSLTASPTSVTSGGASTLTWTVSNATSCTATQGWSGPKNNLGGSQSTGALSVTTTYRLDCTGAGGSAFDTETVTVGSGSGNPNPTFSASPQACGSGSIYLQWAAIGANTFSVWRGSTLIAANVSNNTLTDSGLTANQTYTYTVAAYFLSGNSPTTNTTSAQAPGACGGGAPTVTFTGRSSGSGAYQASPIAVTTGGNVDLQWTVSAGTTSCTKSASSFVSQWSGSSITYTPSGSPITSSQTGLGPINSATTFTLNCTNGSQSTSASFVVNTTSANATINASSNLAGSTWTINGATPVSGSYPSQTHTVTPGSGTVYTLQPSTVNGYSSSVSNSKTGNSNQATIFSGETVTFTVTYTASPPPFAYDLTVGDIGITQGQSGQTTVQKTLQSGTSETVNITASGLPSGVTVSYPNQGSMPPASGFIDLVVNGSVPVGSYPITVDGLSVPSGVADQDIFILNVTPAAAASGSVSCTPATPKVGEPVTCTMTVSPLPCTYVWSGDVPTPAPTTSSFTNTYQTTGTKTVNVDATCGGSTISDSETFYVSVNPAFIEF